MLIFTNQKTISSILRQTYTGGKSSFSSVGSATGFLRPLTEEQASNNGIQWGRGFSLIVETSVDIREGDKVVIDSVEYTVKGMVNYSYGQPTDYKRCLLALPQKQ